MDVLENLKLYVDNLDANINNVQNILEVIFSKSYQEQLSKLDNMNKAKFNIMMAYVIDTLLFVYLKTNGIQTKDHPIMKEIERVKKYFSKIQKLEKNTENKAKFKLDKEAAGRMINHALNNEEMKKEEIEKNVENLLKSVTEEVEKAKAKAKEVSNTENVKTKRKTDSETNTKKNKKAKHK